jgi:hypothetical protein
MRLADRHPRIFRSAICGAPDAHDASHQRGCPQVAPLTKAELLRLALAIEDAWAGLPPRPPAKKDWVRETARELFAARRRSA